MCVGWVEYVEISEKGTLGKVTGEMEGIHNIRERAFLKLGNAVVYLDSVALSYLLLHTPLLPLSPLNREPVQPQMRIREKE